MTLVSSDVALRSSARLRDAVSDALCREIVRARRPRRRGRFSETGPRLGSRTSDRVPGTRGARSPATDFSSLGAREIGRSGGCRISGFPSTSSRRRRRADVVVVVVVARRVAAVEDASATRARRERDASATRTDANRRRSAPPRSNGAARPRRARGGLRLIWNLVVRSHRRASFVGLRARTRTTRERGTLDERRNERSTRDRA